MRHISYMTIAAALCIAAIGCTESTPDDNRNTADGITILPSDRSFYEPVLIDLVLDDLGKYNGYIAVTDYTAGISSSQNDVTKNAETYSYSRIFNKERIIAKSDVSENNIPNIKVDGIPVRNQIMTKSSKKTDWSPAFGNTVTFEIPAYEPATRSTDSGLSGSKNVELYIPEQIQITFPPVAREEEMFPLCYYDVFVIRWNEDPDNENGVIVVVEWLGAMVFGGHNPNAYIRYTTRVDDTGEVLLSTDMFEGIPDTAICHLTLLRGNLENVIADDCSYKLIGESHLSLPFVLIREIRYK